MKNWYVVPLLLFWGVIVAVFNPFTLAIHVDEWRFIRTSELFAKSWIPSVETLRTYPELNTPLIFILWGWGVKIFGPHLWVGRIFNITLGFLISVGFVKCQTNSQTPVVQTLLGVLLFPYFIFCSIYMYTDIFAVFLLLISVLFYSRQKHIWAGVFFSLAVFTRQYLIIFAAALVVYQLLLSYSSQSGLKSWANQLWQDRNFYWPYLLPAFTILGWILFLGGMAPKSEIAAQNYESNVLTNYNLVNMLYGMASMGAFCVVLEGVLFPKQIKNLLKITPLSIAAMLLFTVLFVLFAPLKQPVVAAYNTQFTIKNMGALHFAMQAITPFFGKWAPTIEQTAYWFLGLLCCLRFFRYVDMLTLFALFHFVLLTKTFWAWDKYNLPLVLLFWLAVRSQEVFPGKLEMKGFYGKLTTPLFSRL